MKCRACGWPHSATIRCEAAARMRACAPVVANTVVANSPPAGVVANRLVANSTKHGRRSTDPARIEARRQYMRDLMRRKRAEASR